MSIASSGARSPFASLGARVGAFLLDAAVSGFATILFLLPAAAWAVLPMPQALLWLLVPVALLGQPLLISHSVGRTGFSPGKRMVGLKVLDVHTGHPIGFGRSVVRFLVFAVLGPLDLVQLATIPHSPRRQGWHDKAAGSIVVAAAPAVGRVLPSPSLSSPLPPVPKPLANRLASRSTAWPPSGPFGLAQSRARSLPVGLGIERRLTVAHAARGGGPGGELLAGHVAEDTWGVEDSTNELPEGAPEEAGTIRRHRAGVWRLRTRAGDTQVLVGQVLAGRGPDVSVAPSAEGWALDDLEFSVSKTHALFGKDGAQPWVLDAYSTNGVTLHRAGRSWRIAPNVLTRMQAGDRVALGDFDIEVIGPE
ncbi:MAG: RDD family protein [Nocardioides sp.]